MQPEYTVSCPYCGESFVTLLDPGAEHQIYVEDCQICCQPIVFEVSLDTMSGHPTVTTRREND